MTDSLERIKVVDERSSGGGLNDSLQRESNMGAMRGKQLLIQ